MPDGVRVQVDGQDHLFDRTGWSGLPELISTQSAAFTHSPEGVINQIGVTRESLLADGLGSVRTITDTAGAVSGTTSYDVFGEITTQTGTGALFGFTGAQQSDDLVYLNARYLSPDVARFLTVDPVRPGAPSVTGYNPYTYVNNNPTTSIDPSGQLVDYSALLQKDATVTVPAAGLLGQNLQLRFLALAIALIGSNLCTGIQFWGGTTTPPPQTEPEVDTETQPGSGTITIPETPPVPQPQPNEEEQQDPPITDEDTCE